MRDGHHTGFAHRGMAHEHVFQIDGADPFATGLDHVFAAVDDLDDAIVGHGGDIAGPKPTVGTPAIFGFGGLVVFASNPGPAHLEFANGLAVAWGYTAGRHHAKLDKGERPTCQRPDCILLVGAVEL